MIPIKVLFIFYLIHYSLQLTNESKVAEKLYSKLFKKQRVEQLDAIKSLRKISKYEKQYSMINMMAEKIFKVIQESRATIESSSFIPGISEFPVDDQIRDALSNVLENTALFCEIVLRFPDISVAVLKTNNNWDSILQWGISFTNQMFYLIDNATMTLLNLASQELNHIKREPNYVNPYRKTPQKDKGEEIKKAKKKKKKEIKKGPRFHYEL